MKITNMAIKDLVKNESFGTNLKFKEIMSLQNNLKSKLKFIIPKN